MINKIQLFPYFIHTYFFSPEVMFNKILFAPVMSLLFNNGEDKALSIAFTALFSPEATCRTHYGYTLFVITVSTSAKSTFIYHVQ